MIEAVVLVNLVSVDVGVENSAFVDHLHSTLERDVCESDFFSNSVNAAHGPVEVVPNFHYLFQRPIVESCAILTFWVCLLVFYLVVHPVSFHCECIKCLYKATLKKVFIFLTVCVIYLLEKVSQKACHFVNSVLSPFYHNILAICIEEAVKDLIFMLLVVEEDESIALRIYFKTIRTFICHFWRELQLCFFLEIFKFA